RLVPWWCPIGSQLRPSKTCLPSCCPDRAPSQRCHSRRSPTREPRLGPTHSRVPSRTTLEAYRRPARLGAAQSYRRGRSQEPKVGRYRASRQVLPEPCELRLVYFACSSRTYMG